METSTLRWILIIIGIIIVGSIFLFGNPDKKRKPKASRTGNRQERLEPTLDGASPEELGLADGESDYPADDDGPPDQRELEIEIGDAEPERQSASATASAQKPASPPPGKILSLFLLARDNHIITGAELLQAAVNTGMEYGDMNIFHRIPEGSEQPVFSMANAAKPGQFERDEWNTFETGGVVLFMTLPGPVYSLDAWDSMLATARRMGEILNADLLDEERKPFTRQREAQVREEIRDFDRNQS